MGKLGKAQLEEAIAKWFRETDGIYPLDEIVNKFHENSKEAIVAALENLKEKGVLYGGKNVVNCTYGYTGEEECLADDLISMNINGNSFNAIFATVDDEENITENPSIEEKKISKKVRKDEGKIAGANERLIVNGQFSIVIPEGYTYSMNKNEIGQHRELVFIKEEKNDTYTVLEDFSLDSPFPAPQCLTIMAPNSIGGPHDLSSENVREDLRNIAATFGSVLGCEKLTAIKETSDVLVYYTEFASKNKNTYFMILTEKYIYNGQIWLNDVSTKKERDSIARKWLKSISNEFSKEVQTKKIIQQPFSETKKETENNEDLLNAKKRAEEKRCENKKYMEKIEKECGLKVEQFLIEIKAFIDDKEKSLKEEYSNRIKNIQQEISLTEEQLKALNIFKFKEKKALKMKIEELTSELRSYSNPSKIKLIVEKFKTEAHRAELDYRKKIKEYLNKRFLIVENKTEKTKNGKVTQAFLEEEIIKTMRSLKHEVTVNQIIEENSEFKNNSNVTNVNVSKAITSLVNKGIVMRRTYYFELADSYKKEKKPTKEQLKKEIEQIEMQYSENPDYAGVPYPEPPSIESVFKSVE